MGIKQAIDIDSKQKKELLTLFNTYLPNTKIWAYGSRVKWSAKPSSDLDLVAFSQSAQTSAVSKLKDALVESDLPFKVDLLTWDDIPNSFQVNIKENYFELQSDKQEGLPSGWRVVKLGEVIETANTGLDAIKRAPIVKQDTGIKCLRIQDISQNKEYKNWGFTNVEQKNFAKFQLRKNDIFIARTGATVGVNRIIKNKLNSVFNNGLIRLRATDKILPSYLFYNFRSSKYKYFINNISSGTSTQPNMKINDFLGFDILLPPLPEQKAIAHILGKSDDKIELNRQINQTLETMAQTLFKSWFVNFDPVIDNAIKSGNPIPDPLKPQAQKRKTIKSTLPKTTQDLFPNSFVFNDKLKKWIPEGWVVSTINEVSKVICGKTPSKSKKEYYDGNIPFVKIPNMHNEVYALETSEYLTGSGSESQPNKLIPKGGISVSCIATVGKVVLIDKASHTNQQINSIIPNENYYRYYLYFLMLSLNRHFHDLASAGSATLNMNTSTFSNIKITMPNNGILKAYDKQVKPHFEIILSNQKQTQTLTKLRDTLLPKLISGKIRVSYQE